MGQNNSSQSNSFGSSITLSKNNGSNYSYMTADYETSVKQFLDTKKKEFEDKFKYSGALSQFNLSSAVSIRLSQERASSVVKLDDFELDRTIGTGSFGRVMIVYTKNNRSQRYAMKMLKKDNIVKMKQIEHTLNEKKILSSIDFPFIVKLVSSFKDNSNLYMVLIFILF
jgi:hypothetical protein